MIALSRALLLGLAALAAAGCSKPEQAAAPGAATTAAAPASAVPVAPTAPATSTASVLPDRVYWGDEHVHTGWSADAGLAGATLDPEAAVRFARGEAVKSNSGSKTAQLHRPYDWVAVTDHSDGMGTISELRDGNPEFMADPTGKRWFEMMREGGEQGAQAQREAVSAQAGKTLPKVFMDPKWGVSAWEKTVDIMERYNEPGKFTAFIAYEWTSNGDTGQNLHRNVIFRDGADKTRATPPLTTFESAAPGRKPTDPESLWQWLSEWEAKTGGKVLAIPHNANLSNGWMFREARYGGEELNPEWAAARARWEPIIEIFQYKGSSETHPTLAMNDEFAGFELWDTADLAGNAKPDGAYSGEYLRTALSKGLRLQQTLGTNPFAYGTAGGTDTHTGLATTEEDNFWGKFANLEPSAERWSHVSQKEEKYTRRAWTQAAGGLTAVWSHENTRAALWDAMKRKETYATSGSRITLRFFGGYGFSDEDAKGDVAGSGYAKGVPMGGNLAAVEGQAPSFLIAALKDPDGANLDRVQVVKGWVDAAGETHEKVFDVLWSGERTPGADGKLPPLGSSVDVAKASYTNSIGASELVGRFVDPEFKPGERAYYYARVIEIPTPRWTAFDVLRFGVKMDPEVPMVIQERAVSSPIWYAPAM